VDAYGYSDGKFEVNSDANAQPTVVEEEKPANEKGHYLHPREWGQPEERGIDRVCPP